MNKLLRSKKTKRAISEGWAIKGADGRFYADWRHTRQGMVRKHIFDLGKTWKQCYRNGDRCVRVLIMEASE